jgi:hypothetical protein
VEEAERERKLHAGDPDHHLSQKTLQIATFFTGELWARN